jgi:Uri superfamily endonuclease
VKGTYTILMEFSRPLQVRFGGLGSAKVEKGCYVYTGSALGKGAVSLEGRLSRHFHRAKKIKWHVDYLTTRRGCAVSAAVYVKSRKRLECLVNRRLTEALGAKLVLRHLGASDCTCPAHFFQVGGLRSALAGTVGVYAEFGEPCLVNGRREDRMLVP